MFKRLAAILAQHRRLTDLERTLSALEQRLERLAATDEELRADLDWLAGEIKKLRGRVTGGSRKPAVTEPGSNGPDPARDINAEIRAGTFSRGRR